MKWWAFLLVCAAWAQERHGNRFVLRAQEGAADLEFNTPSTFRFRRTFAQQLTSRPDGGKDPIDVTVTDSAVDVSFTTTYLIATIRKDDLRVEVRKAADGAILMKDLSPAERRDGVISLERLAEPNVRFYGLGAKTDSSLNLRGARIDDAVPFLISTAGYGEQYMSGGRFVFDIARLRTGSYRVDIRNSDTLDYYFYFGPTPKEIFDERLKAAGARFAAPANPPSFRWLVEQSLSGVFLPVETVTTPVPIDLRKRLDIYLGAYIQEVHDRGCPILHPLPVQFPRDPDADKYADEAMLGDELLLATGRSVYLPQGIWTNLKSNVVVKGRQVIQTSEAPSVFARNGSIVPLAGSDTLELHYFPKLGAEFFLYEESAGEYTQIHAAPAVDIVRLQIESKVARDYTWVIHNLDAVKAVTSGGAAFVAAKTATPMRDRTWYYDAALHNLYVRDRIAAGQDHIVNLSF